MIFVGFIVLGFAALGRVNWTRAALYVAAVSVCFVAIVNAMGAPRPIWTFLHRPKGGILIASQAEEPRAIFVWVLLPGSETPVAIRLTWNEQEAAQLQAATEAAKARHGKVGMRLQRGKPEFYTSTLAALPPKEK